MNLNFIQKNKISPSPQISLKDIYKSLLTFLLKKKKDSYKSIYKAENCFVYPRSTLSIYKLYDYLNNFHNKKILFIPDFICNEFLSLLRKTNAKIVFYDHTLINDKKLIT